MVISLFLLPILQDCESRSNDRGVMMIAVGKTRLSEVKRGDSAYDSHVSCEF